MIPPVPGVDEFLTTNWTFMIPNAKMPFQMIPQIFGIFENFPAKLALMRLPIGVKPEMDIQSGLIGIGSWAFCAFELLLFGMFGNVKSNIPAPLKCLSTVRTNVFFCSDFIDHRLYCFPRLW